MIENCDGNKKIGNEFDECSSMACSKNWKQNWDFKLQEWNNDVWNIAIHDKLTSEIV